VWGTIWVGLLTNIRLARKNLLVIKAPAYFASTSVPKKKVNNFDSEVLSLP
jgi:hypothetical protein